MEYCKYCKGHTIIVREHVTHPDYFMYVCEKCGKVTIHEVQTGKIL